MTIFDLIKISHKGRMFLCKRPVPLGQALYRHDDSWNALALRVPNEDIIREFYAMPTLRFIKSTRLKRMKKFWAVAEQGSLPQLQMRPCRWLAENSKCYKMGRSASHRYLRSFAFFAETARIGLTQSRLKIVYVHLAQPNAWKILSISDRTA